MSTPNPVPIDPSKPTFPVDLLPLVAQSLHAQHPATSPIGRRIGDNDVRSALVALQRTCMAAYKAVTPLIYSRVRLEDRSAWGAFFLAFKTEKRNPKAEGEQYVEEDDEDEDVEEDDEDEDDGDDGEEGGDGQGVGGVEGGGVNAAAKDSQAGQEPEKARGDLDLHVPLQRARWAFRFLKQLDAADIPFVYDNSDLWAKLGVCIACSFSSRVEPLFPNLKELRMGRKLLEKVWAISKMWAHIPDPERVTNTTEAVINLLAPASLHVTIPDPSMIPEPRHSQNFFTQRSEKRRVEVTTVTISTWVIGLQNRLCTFDFPFTVANAHFCNASMYGGLAVLSPTFHLSFAEPAISSYPGKSAHEQMQMIHADLRILIGWLETFLEIYFNALRSSRLRVTPKRVAALSGVIAKFEAGKEGVEAQWRKKVTKTIGELVSTIVERDLCGKLEGVKITVDGVETFQLKKPGEKCMVCGCAEHDPAEYEDGDDDEYEDTEYEDTDWYGEDWQHGGLETGPGRETDDGWETEDE